MYRRLVTLAALIAVPLVTGCGGKDRTPIAASKEPTAATRHADAPAGDDDLRKLQGVWVVTDIDTGDPTNKPKPDELKGMRVEVQGAKWKVNEGGRLVYMVVALHPNSQPKGIDLTESDEKGNTGPVTVRSTPKRGKPGVRQAPRSRQLGVYALGGDALRIALGEPDAPRPKELAAVRHVPSRTRSDQKPVKYVPGVVLMTLRRETK